MSAARLETEIKLPFDSATEARERLSALGARVRHDRHFEDNVLFDRDANPLRLDGKALRLRRARERTVLTLKGPVQGAQRYKVRSEDETEVADFASATRILHGLGLRPLWRYQKYRTTFDLESLQICLDETPLGCFVELEGAPDAIDRVAAALGFSAEDYIRDSYRSLEERRAAARGEKPGDLIYDRGGD